MPRHDMSAFTARYQADVEFRSAVDSGATPADLLDEDLEAFSGSMDQTVGFCTGRFFCQTVGGFYCTAGPGACGH